jgi:hypothetical protein
MEPEGIYLVHKNLQLDTIVYKPEYRAAPCSYSVKNQNKIFYETKYVT